MFVYHQIEAGTPEKICVAVRPLREDNSLEITIHPGTNPDGYCKLAGKFETDNIFGIAPFAENIPTKNIAAAVAKLLEVDGQAYRDLVNGSTIVKKVRGTPPPPTTPLPESSPLANYRTLRMNAVDQIRPMFLPQPSFEPLLEFQKEGVNWLMGREKAILADDMGLGKTVQAIYALRLLFNKAEINSAMVLAPKSLIANWEEELSRWAPELSRVRLIPKASVRTQAWQTVIGACHVILTNYEQMRRPPDILIEEGIDVIVADEAHRMRNIGSQVTQGVRRVKARRFWALTGTPFERDPEDLATLLSMLEPSKFSTSDRHLHPASLRSQARPYVLRRLKEHVLSDLPQVLEHQEVLELLPGQRESYLRALREVSSAERTQMLALINELRTICDFDERTGQSSKLDRILERLEDISASKEKVVVFSYLLKPLDVLEERLKKRFGREAVLNLRGEMSFDERRIAINRFMTDPDTLVLLCSLRVSGEGLTLTAANHVIFVNEWWNPSANAQARDRVVRIGQQRGVRLYKFRCKNTIEDNLEEILHRKSQEMVALIDGLADPNNAPSGIDSLLSRLVPKR